MTFLVGVDAGASHTEAVVAADPHRILGRAKGPAGSVGSGGTAESSRVIEEIVRQALSLHGHPGTIRALVAGVAGTGREPERLELEVALRDRLPEAQMIAVTTDGEIALTAAFGEAGGIVLCAGTGSVAWARESDGALLRAGGYGRTFGDEGGGYAIARAALSAAGRAHDGRTPETALTQALLAGAGTDEFDGLIRWAGSATPEEIASLAPVVIRACEAGDPNARALLEDAAAELSDLVRAVAARVTGGATQIALAGGLLRAGSPIRTMVVERIGRDVPRATILDVTVNPALGALAMAARLG